MEQHGNGDVKKRNSTMKVDTNLDNLTEIVENIPKVPDSPNIHECFNLIYEKIVRLNNQVLDHIHKLDRLEKRIEDIENEIFIQKHMENLFINQTRKRIFRHNII